jgi:hypothetical protein
MRYIALPVYGCCLARFVCRPKLRQPVCSHCIALLVSLFHIPTFSPIFTSFDSWSICFVVLCPCFLVGCHISFCVLMVFLLLLSCSTSNANGILVTLHYLLVLLLQFVQFECIQTSFVCVFVMISLLFLWHTYSWSYAPAAFINWFHAHSCVSVALLCMHIQFDDPCGILL